MTATGYYRGSHSSSLLNQALGKSVLSCAPGPKPQKCVLTRLTENRKRQTPFPSSASIGKVHMCQLAREPFAKPASAIMKQTSKSRLKYCRAMA